MANQLLTDLMALSVSINGTNAALRCQILLSSDHSVLAFRVRLYRADQILLLHFVQQPLSTRLRLVSDAARLLNSL